MNQAIAFGHFALLLALLGIMVQLNALTPGAALPTFVFAFILWTAALVFVALEWSALGRQR